MNAAGADGHSLSGPAQSLDARTKLALALSLLVGINLTPARAWPALVAYLLVLLAFMALARLAPRRVLARSLVALPFVLLASAGLPFGGAGTPPWTAHILGWQVVITDASLWRFVTILARSWLSLWVAVTLALTTPFTELARALSGLGVPHVLTATILFTYRYLWVLLDEARRLIRAREARSGELVPGHGGGRLRWRARVTGQMIGTLFLRTYERSERIYQAMLARGFDGEIRALRRPRLTRRDWLWGAAGLALAALVAGLANLYG